MPYLNRFTYKHRTARDVWEALLDEMPVTALVRNLPAMNRVGLLEPGSAATARVVAQLRDAAGVRRARVHPIAVLAALRAYESGHGADMRVFNPVTQVVDALHAAFYAAVDAVQPTNRRMLLALDASGSDGGGRVAGLPALTARDAAAALALVTAATEPCHEVVGFCAGHRGSKRGGTRAHGWGEGGISPLSISPRLRLDDVVRAIEGLPSGASDCTLPMRYAQATGREVDTFVIYTASATATTAGDTQAGQALEDYRRASGIEARLVVVTPQLIADYARGEL